MKDFSPEKAAFFQKALFILSFACFAASAFIADFTFIHCALALLIGGGLSLCGYNDAIRGETFPYSFALMLAVVSVATGFQCLYHAPELPYYFLGIVVRERVFNAILLEMAYPWVLSLFLLEGLLFLHFLERKAGRPLMGAGDLKCFVAAFFLPYPVDTLLMAFCGGLFLTVVTAFVVHRSLSSSVRVLPHFVPAFAACLLLIQLSAR